MTVRNNEARLGQESEERASVHEEALAPKPLTFAVPTEMVDLPSGGKFYPEGHPLHGVESVEIKFMTAKEEDILTSRSLLKKGIALDRLIQSVMVNPKVDPDDMLVGDRNAIIVASRITGYGSDYKTKVACPACGEHSQHQFDLEESQTIKGGDVEGATITSDGTWIITLPVTNWEVEVRLLTGRDEKHLASISEKKKKSNMAETPITDQLNLIVVSVQGHKDKPTVQQAISALPAKDALHLRDVYTKINPNIDLTQAFVCQSCDFETQMEVPFTTDFFWFKR